MISSLDLARLSGCSQGTVDRALHDRPGISGKTKQHILALAAKHGYRPHPAARELLTGDRRTVGAIIPAINSVFFMDLMNSIREALGGYRFVITQVADTEQFLDTLEEFASLRVRMVIAVPPESAIAISPELAKELNLVSIVNPCVGRGVTNLIPDEIETGRLATRYLLAKGHARIVHVRPLRDSVAIHDRARGYETTMAEHGLPAVVVNNETADGLLVQLKSANATAVLCHNDWLALSVMRSLNSVGLRVPEDVSVMGVDDSPTFTALFPELTTMHYPAESVAQAVRQCIEGKRNLTIANATVVERTTVRSIQ
ncbi:LacI family DNA-binding transcriptional regulator [soil metagenome]